MAAETNKNFKVETFLEDPDVDVFDILNKDNLIALGKNFGLSLTKAVHKSIIKQTVLNKLIEQEIFSEENLDYEESPSPSVESPNSSVELQLKLAHEKEMKEKELEMKKIELKAKERELAIQHEFELEKMKLQMDLQAAKKQNYDAEQSKFVISKHFSMVPQFSEKEPDIFFVMFEKIATNLNWPKEHWSMLVQSVLVGKARKIYTQLSVDQASSYDTVKELVLKGYELVPEAYRQKFRNWEKRNDQTYVEFARTKEQFFDRWCSSRDIDQSYDNLRQLILVEEFKNCVSSDIRTFIDEQNALKLDVAARLADDYALTHKSSFVGKSKNFSSKNFSSSKQSSQNKNVKGQSSSTSTEKSNETSSPAKSFSKVTCKFCKRDGHLISDCWKLKKKEKEEEQAKASLVVATATPSEQTDVKSSHCVATTKHYCHVEKCSNDTQGFHFLCDSKIEFCNPDLGHCSSVVEEKSFFDSNNEFSADSSREFETVEEHSSNSSNSDPSKEVEVNLEDSSIFSDESGDTSCHAESDPVLDPELEDYLPFIHDGFVSLSSDFSNKIPIKYLRDTGSRQTFLLDSTMQLSQESFMNAYVFSEGMFSETIATVPLHQVYFESGIITGPIAVGILPRFPVKGVQLILGNDVAGDKVKPSPIVTVKPSLVEVHADPDIPGLYPSCAVTRSMAKKQALEESKSSDVHENDTKVDETDTTSFDLPEQDKLFSRSELIAEQHSDPEIACLFSRAVDHDEILQNAVCFYEHNDVLMRKWRPADVSPDDEWAVRHQIVVPKSYRKAILSMGHDVPLSGHLGIKRTYHKILTHFYWPNLRKDVVKFCRSCHTCQMVGKSNQSPPKAPLKPIPAFEEPFSRILVDCVGPLPKTKSGNEYLLTIMCAGTRFPEAIPLRNIKARTIVKALTKFFTIFGLPRSVQSDQGTNFTSGLFQQVMYELGIKQYTSSAYHPESQGALERFHQTLKNMIRMYCFDTQKDWDEGIHLLLFAARDSFQESLGFSPFELVFGHSVRGPLKLMKEKLLADDPDSLNLLQYVSDFRTKLTQACQMAQENLKSAQNSMKECYDKKTVKRDFKPGDKVLALLPIPGKPLQARYFGPYVIDKKLSELNYVVTTPDRRKNNQLCHVNMLKLYYDRNGINEIVKPVGIVNSSTDPASKIECSDSIDSKPVTAKLKNSDVLNDLHSKLKHLSSSQQDDLLDLLQQYELLFPDVPTRTDVLFHDVDVNDADAVKQHPYRLNPEKQKYLQEEIQYLLDNDFIEPSNSDWSSPCILVPKPDGSYRMCTDYRKLNSVTKTDSFPIPRIEDCIDRVGNSTFVSKFDLLKGFWQVPLTQRAKEVSAFVTPQGLFQYKVMPFGMKNSPATFQRLINKVIGDIDGCDAYIDDIVVYSSTWEKHLQILRQLFQKLATAKLTVNLVKSEFGHAQVTFLGHVVGQGQVKPVNAKVNAISEFPRPETKKQIMRFLGMVGYYRKFCPNFSHVAEPLTNLLKKSKICLDCTL